MADKEHPRLPWIAGLPAGPPAKYRPEHIREQAGGYDGDENPYYRQYLDDVNDPQYVMQETSARRRRGAYLRRLRRLASRKEDVPSSVELRWRPVDR